MSCAGIRSVAPAYAVNFLGAERFLVELDRVRARVTHQVWNKTIVAGWNRAGGLAHREASSVYG
jgi:hypothetical protein